MLPDGAQGAVAVVDKIRESLRRPFDLGGHEVTLTASIGIAVAPGDAADADTLLKYADTAMYSAKQAGRDAYRFFTSEMNEQSLARLELENALRRALDNKEFVLHFQPKLDIATAASAAPRRCCAGSGPATAWCRRRCSSRCSRRPA